ncbi:transient receptor potential cation channel subfamily M member-like 2 [Physella acuta]|uniref:transient receptor potential cation channel subfamily M member-like 2 n=1 Tax=Physella acuta TaxID=109671 RepID=UPI0027DB11DB|nr:transient receptor potential cation channel subfamily M member-like 2 [Physella acuta]XP_059174641.1 transient receptor potential cation channel subfamily M member-like 2 [Physella acuta]
MTSIHTPSNMSHSFQGGSSVAWTGESPDLSASMGKSELKEAYITGRRRQMGFKARSVQEKEDLYLQLRDQQIKYIKETFYQKECNKFIPLPGQCGNGKTIKAKDVKCHCGEVLMMHAGIQSRATHSPYSNARTTIPPEFEYLLKYQDQDLIELPKSKDTWDQSSCFSVTPTTAFGRIDFNVEQVGGKKPSKYLRLCIKNNVEETVDKCLDLLKNYWNMMDPEPPHLVISVVGGAKNFKLDGRMRETFSTGLIKAAKTTNAWLITSGFNMGVMKAVGQAVHEGQSFQWKNDKMTHVLRCIGIAPWGYVKGRKYLESSDGKGKFNAYYRTSNQIIHKQPVPLNPDHTHFIFVDDGYRYRYGGVADFRSKFEKKIASGLAEKGLEIPLVLLLVEGGTDAIQDASVSLAQGIPVVVCAGTGRAADILAYAYNHTKTNGTSRVMKDTHQDKLAQKIYIAYKDNLKQGKEKDELEALKDKVIDCCKNEDLMTIFNMNKHEDLDSAILSALFKAKISSSRENQLNLAFTWNRADIAQEEIFREDVIWKEGSLAEFLTKALIENKVEFVKLLLNNGIIMQEYLTKTKLEALYKSIPKHSHLQQISSFPKEEHLNLDSIGKFIQSMLDKYEHNFYVKEDKSHKFSNNNNVSSILFASALRHKDLDSSDDGTEPNAFMWPYKQLLIWAVLLNRYELAHLFWELGEEPIASALICTVLCARMDVKVPKYLTALKNDFHKMKTEFEQIAISVLDECHNVDPDKAMMLIERESPVWNGLTCLQIAASASDQAFVSSVASQNSINNVWKNGIAASWPKVFLCALFPLLIPLIMEISMFGERVQRHKDKLILFYTSPLTKFSLYSASYLAFLALFTYMLMVDYMKEPSVTEWIILIWIISLLVGEIHSFIVFPSPSFSGKLRDFFGVLDRLAFINYVLAIIGFIVRWTHRSETKVIYCINAVIFYIRVMKLYTANRRLGPKIYMINRMLQELAMFVMVLMVFLMAYGVASQGLLYKNRSKEWLILKDILYFPYWQLFGELFLEELETDGACTSSLKASHNFTALPDEFNTCRTYHWLVPLLLALYLLIGNVLLLNLLIAIFSHVFDTVEKNAIDIWKFQMYSLVMEFKNRPLLFPPLSILSDISTFFQWVYKKISAKKRMKTELYQKHQLEFLSFFEKEMMANKMRTIKENDMQSVDTKFRILQTRMDELRQVIEDDLMTEQQYMMQVFDADPKAITKVQVEESNPGVNTTAQDSSEPRRKHKHKKKKKKKDKDMPVVEEVKDESSPDDIVTDKKVKVIPEVDLTDFDMPRIQAVASPKVVLSPTTSKRFNYSEIDSEEEIPLEIYSPRVPKISLRPSISSIDSHIIDNTPGASYQQVTQRKSRQQFS